MHRVHAIKSRSQAAEGGNRGTGGCTANDRLVKTIMVLLAECAHIAVITAAASAVFGPCAVSDAGFLSHDDPQNFLQNPHIQAATAANLRWIVADGTVLGVYEPVALLFKLGWWTAAGLGASSSSSAARTCRLVSLGLHCAVCGAAYLLLARAGPCLLPAAKLARRWSTQSRLALGTAAACIAAITSTPRSRLLCSIGSSSDSASRLLHDGHPSSLSLIGQAGAAAHKLLLVAWRHQSGRGIH